MKQPQRRSPQAATANDFRFTGQARKFPPVQSIPFRWPKKVSTANDYVESWHREARAALAALKLSSVTLDTIASHISRKEGITTLTDGALSARTGRSLASTERDIQRLKQLGFLMAEHQPLSGRQGRHRVLKLSLPVPIIVPQRIPSENQGFCPSTYPPYVEGIDIGERRDV